GRGTRLENTPRIGDDGVKLAEYLGSDVKRYRRFALGGFKQSAARYMLRRVGVERIDQNVCVNYSRFNGHRYRCRAGAANLLRRQDARRAKDWRRLAVGLWECQHSRQAGVRPRPSPNARCWFQRW